ncbi:MAG TPA: YtxH domain-containing protein [Gemmatimonadales bacterium]|jgi:gas vesicle protein|nr:YtxH domain-containing protein [Gemmatimonadales bacterium]
MVTQNRRIDDPMDPWSTPSRSEGGLGAGSLLMGTLLGIGIGLLAAPQPGTKTRKLLLQRLSALGEEAGDTLEEVQGLTQKARKKARQRLSQLREDAEDGWDEVEDRWQKTKRGIRGEEEDSSPFGTILAIAAGVAATYLLTSDRAAPVRSRVQHAAEDVKRRATDEWGRFQRGGFRARRAGAEDQEGRSETRTSSTPSNEAPEAS